MDEYNDKPSDAVRALARAGSANDGAINGHDREARAASATRTVALSTTPVKPEEQHLHRARISRIFLMKLRHGRVNRKESATPRLLTVIVIIFAVLFSLFSGGVGGALAYYQSQLPLLNAIANHTSFQSTRIYDRKGRLLYELYDPRYGRRTYVNYTDISPLLVNATVAAEDHTFWNNSGVDLQGTLRAALANVQNQTVVEGGSTITQQLIKNQLFLAQPRTLQIKGQEAFLAYGLTQQYPKWKIMEMYLNTVYYGDLNYGVESAAKDYFNLQGKCIARSCQQAVSN